MVNDTPLISIQRGVQIISFQEQNDWALVDVILDEDLFRQSKKRIDAADI